MRRRGVPLALVLVALGGCGIDPQSAPEDIAVAPVPMVTAGPPEPSSAARVRLWFLDDDRLARVPRGAARSSPEDALRLLVAGPHLEETETGLTTAITGDPFTVIDDHTADGVLTLEVTSAFISVPGNDQRQAVAQVVWTMTEFRGIDYVRFRIDDDPVEVPTDHGLSDQPVDRDDFRSMAPPDAAPAAAD